MTRLYDKYDFPSRRSNLFAGNGAVATSQPLAAQFGLNILQAGGNAVDAAIATAAALCVVEPCSTGIGGDAFALIWLEKERKLYGLNASGPAPADLTADWIREQGHTEMPALGGIPVTVPGALRGWQLALERFGSMGLEQLLAPAIAYADEGFHVSQLIAGSWARSEEKMGAHPDSSRVWLPGGRAPRPGERFRNPEIAGTLRTIAQNGVDAFYQGEIAAQIARCVQQAGGKLSEADLANYRAEWVEPIQIPYRDGYTFYEIPPNGQGLTALLALNIAQSYDFSTVAWGSPDHLHPLMESIKLGFADAAAFIADPRQADVPVEALLSASYTASRSALISPDKALTPTPGEPSQHGDTVYLTVADRDGNMVSWIQSLYMGFGSGLTAGDTGVQLHNRGANFSLQAGHPNQAAGGKRPYNTIIPGFIGKDGAAWASFGVMGGFMQPQGHLQVGVNLVDYGMSPQTALDASRFQWLRDLEIAVEPAFAPRTIERLAEKGHQLRAGLPGMAFGGGQIILKDEMYGGYIAGSEPRKDGSAVGW